MIPSRTRMSGSRQLAATILLFCFAAASGLHAQVTNASVSGTYTFQFGSADGYVAQFNMFGQQVGFCPSATYKLPFGYSCFFNPTASDLTTGTVVADGKGNVVTGSSFTNTYDPQEYECAKKANPVTVCPYKVPSGKVWSSTAAYVVGALADYTVNGKVLTFQAVKNNTNVSPSTSECTATVQPPNCNWDQVYQSAASGVSSTKTDTMTGTYTMQSNGSGVMHITPTGATSGSSFSILVQPAPLAVGQVISLQGMSLINNENNATGMAVRVK
jgi:hypothetical protein